MGVGVGRVKLFDPQIEHLKNGVDHLRDNIEHICSEILRQEHLFHQLSIDHVCIAVLILIQ